MAVPKSRQGTARTNKRRSHHAHKPKSLAKCSRCSQTVRPHTVCGNCGHYRGNVIVNMEDDLG